MLHAENPRLVLRHVPAGLLNSVLDRCSPSLNEQDSNPTPGIWWDATIRVRMGVATQLTKLRMVLTLLGWSNRSNFRFLPPRGHLKSKCFFSLPSFSYSHDTSGNGRAAAKLQQVFIWGGFHFWLDIIYYMLNRSKKNESHFVTI